MNKLGNKSIDCMAVAKCWHFTLPHKCKNWAAKLRRQAQKQISWTTLYLRSKTVFGAIIPNINYIIAFHKFTSAEIVLRKQKICRAFSGTAYVHTLPKKNVCPAQSNQKLATLSGWPCSASFSAEIISLANAIKYKKNAL